MPEPVWYKSLYWRIAFGFVATLAALLLAQGVVLLWLTDRLVGGLSRSPVQLAGTVATDLSAALAANPQLRLEEYVQEEFGHIYQPFVIVMRDGRTAVNRPGPLPPQFARAVQRRFSRGLPLTGFDPRDDDGRDGRRGGGRRPDRMSGDAPPVPGPGAGPGPGHPPMGGPPDGGGPPRDGGRFAESASIVVGDTEIGLVAVPINPLPVPVAIRELGPTLTWTGLGLLAIGAAGAALLIFGPTHRRLRSLEQAARALGEGRTEVRATETGGDEVSSLAHTFNRMADDLSGRAAALAASDRARRQLLADVSHELMTPLAAIRGYTETLAMPELPIDASTRQQYLGIIGEETQKLEGLIGDLLDLARLEGGGGTLTIEDVPVKELCRRIADRHRPTLHERGITLELDVRPPDLTVRADGQRLEQALQNLAANSVRHTPRGGTVRIHAEEASDFTRITVRDTGPGIPPEHLPHIFERFYKVDAARSATTMSGSGLGLSIVQAIVERHGGTVTATNAPDGGASFEIRLPLAAQP
jgi:two-component system, OmpR family, sensor kinase